MRRLLAMPLLLIVSCRSTSLTSNPLAPTLASGTGVVYYLPKTLLRVAIPYTVTEKRQFTNGQPGTPTISLRITKPIVLTPTLVADTTQPLIADTKTLSERGMLASSVDLKLDDTGTITSLDAQAEDQSGAVLQSVVSAVVSIAKIAAVAGTTAPPPAVKKLQDRISADFEKLSDTTLTLEQLKVVTEEIALLLNGIKTYQDANREELTTRDVTYTVVLDPADFVPTADQKAISATIRPTGIVAGLDAAQTPEVTISIALTPEERTQATESLATTTKSPINGVLYRTPKPLTTSVTIPSDTATLEVFREPISYPQFGALGIAPVTSKSFATQKTIITMAGAGSLKGYKIDGTSSAQGAATSVATALDSVQKSLLDIKVGQELELLKKQKELQDAQKALQAPQETDDDKKLAALRKEKELLDAQLAVEKAKKDLEDLTKPKP